MTTIQEYRNAEGLTKSTYYDMYGNQKTHWGNTPIPTTTGFWLDMTGVPHEYTWDYKKVYPDITQTKLNKWPTGQKHKIHDTDAPCSNLYCQARVLTEAVYGVNDPDYSKHEQEIVNHIDKNPNTPYEAERKFTKTMTMFFKAASRIMLALFATAILVWGVGLIYYAMTTFEMPQHRIEVPVDTNGIQETIQFDCINPLLTSTQDAMEDAEAFENIYDTLDTCHEIAAHYDWVLE